MKIVTDFDELQDDVYAWSTENFGSEQPPEYPLIGAGEELGELTCSVLKRAQGIDGSDKYADRDVGDDAEMDAIGDIIIYLADACARSDLSLSGSVTNARISKSYGHIDDRIRLIRIAYSAYGELCAGRLTAVDGRSGRGVQESQTNLGSVILALERFAEISEYSFDDCIESAWDDV